MDGSLQPYLSISTAQPSTPPQCESSLAFLHAQQKVCTGQLWGWVAKGTAWDRMWKISHWIIQQDGPSKGPLFCPQIHYVIVICTSPIPTCDALSHGLRRLTLNLVCLPWALND